MADEQHCRTAGHELKHPRAALALETLVADGKNFVHNQNIRLNDGGDGESQTREHSGRVRFQRTVDETIEFAVRNDFRRFAVQKILRVAKNCAVKKDVLPPGEFRVEAAAEFEHGHKRALQGDAAAGGRVNAADDFEQGGFSRAVMANQPGDTALFGGEGYIIEGAEGGGMRLAVEGVEEGFLERNGMSKGELYKPDSLSFGGGRGNGKEFDFSQFSTHNDVSDDSDASDNASTMPDSSSQPSAPDSSADEFAPSSGAPANFPSGGNFAPSSGDRAQNPPSMPNFSFGGATSDSTDADTDGTTTRRTFSMPGGGFSFGMGSNDVKLIYSDDDPDSYSNIFDNAKTKISKKDKARLIESLRKLNAQEDIESVVDTNEVIRYLVVHNFLCNDDSYTGMMVHNYYLYEEDGQLCIIPWDYNLSFGGFSAAQDATSTVNSPIDSPVSGGTVDSRPLISWIFANDDAYSQCIAENFDSGWVAQEIARVQEMITPYLEQDSSKFYTMEEFEKAVETLQTFCDKRAQSIRGQLDGSIPSTSQGQQNSDALVDASDITTSDMGSMNSGKDGGMNFGGAGEFTMPTGFTMPGSAQGTAPSGFTPPDDASFGGSRGSPAQPQTSTAPEAAKSAAPDTTTSTPDTSRTPPEGFTRPDSINGQETQWLQLGIYGAILLMGILIVRKMSAHNE